MEIKNSTEKLKRNLSFIVDHQDTRSNKEDFALTPYISGVWFKGEIISIYGLALTWGWYSVFVGLKNERENN